MKPLCVLAIATISWLTLPTYSKPAADHFENVYSKVWKISIIVGIITEENENIVAKGEIAVHKNQIVPFPMDRLII